MIFAMSFFAMPLSPLAFDDCRHSFLQPVFSVCRQIRARRLRSMPPRRRRFLPIAHIDSFRFAYCCRFHFELAPADFVFFFLISAFLPPFLTRSLLLAPFFAGFSRCFD
jgi:hypothetical protein